MNLQNWVRQARDHWKEHLPNLYRQLKASGTLEQALQDAAERTYRELSEMEDQGHDPQGAWETVRERYLFPPDRTSLYAMLRHDSPAWTPSEPATAAEFRKAPQTGVREIPIPSPDRSASKTK